MKKSAQDVLSQRRAIWSEKPIIRRLYAKWSGRIKAVLKPGKTLELGGGSGNLREFLPHAITSDIVFAPWLDAVMDAQSLPFKEQSLDNVVLFDVLHHLAAPVLFFRELERVLRPGGRAVMMEPYVSWLSFPVYRFLHAEGMTWDADPFRGKLAESKEPFQGNQAIPTLIFEKFREQYEQCFPGLRITLMEKMDMLIYPLSGGFHQPSLCPVFLWKTLARVETFLQPLNPKLAFRLLVVLEKG